MTKEPGFVHGAIRCPDCGSPMTEQYVERISLFCEDFRGRPMILGTGFTCLYCGGVFSLHATVSDMRLTSDDNNGSVRVYDGSPATVPAGDL